MTSCLCLNICNTVCPNLKSSIECLKEKLRTSYRVHVPSLALTVHKICLTFGHSSLVNAPRHRYVIGDLLLCTISVDIASQIMSRYCLMTVLRRRIMPTVPSWKQASLSPILTMGILLSLPRYWGTEIVSRNCRHLGHRSSHTCIAIMAISVRLLCEQALCGQFYLSLENKQTAPYLPLELPFPNVIVVSNGTIPTLTYIILIEP